MSWIILILSGLLEAVWATALGKSEGFTKLWPSVVFAAALTVAYAMVFSGEPISVVKILLILGLVACVVGLKLVNPDH